MVVWVVDVVGVVVVVSVGGVTVSAPVVVVLLVVIALEDVRRNVVLDVVAAVVWDFVVVDSPTPLPD